MDVKTFSSSLAQSSLSLKQNERIKKLSPQRVFKYKSKYHTISAGAQAKVCILEERQQEDFPFLVGAEFL
jgi:hypothetical protein